jgi:hypothetical protein
MNRPALGSLLRLAVGAIDLLLMLPTRLSDEPTALAGAFFDRFAIGFLAVNVTLAMCPALASAVVGLLISIPDAIVTKAYAPVIVTGVHIRSSCRMGRTSMVRLVSH